MSVASELSALADSMSCCLQPGMRMSISTAGACPSTGVRGQSLFPPRLTRFTNVSRTNWDGAAEEVFWLLTEPVGETARASASLLTSLGICAARHRLTRSPLFWLGGCSSVSLFHFFLFFFSLTWNIWQVPQVPPLHVWSERQDTCRWARA